MWLRIPLPYCPYAPDMGGSISQSTLQQMEQLARSVMWRAKYRQPRFWRTLWSTDFYRTRLFGPTCEPSTLALGVEAWISSLRAIRANHSQSPESVVAKAIRATCGQKWLESWRNASPLLAFSRMSQGTLFSDFSKSPKIWSDWVIVLRQECLRRRRLARVTRENGCSSWPTAKTATGDYQYANGKSVLNLSGAARQWLSIAPTDAKGTETAENYSPQAQSTSNGDGSSTAGLSSRPQLNPRFVEWLMGVPVGWTSSGCSEMEFAHYKERMRSALYRLCSGCTKQEAQA